MAEAQDSVQLVESLGVSEHSCAFSKFLRDRGLEEVVTRVSGRWLQDGDEAC